MNFDPVPHDVLSPFSVATREIQSGDSEYWQVQSSLEICMVAQGSLWIEHGEYKARGESKALFVFTEGEHYNLSNEWGEPAQLIRVGTHLGGAELMRFRDLLELPAGRRFLQLTGEQADAFGKIHQRLSLEREELDSLNRIAISALLSLLLVDITRWFNLPTASQSSSSTTLTRGGDSDCFELWRKIHQHAFRPETSGALFFGTNPNHDSLRHRFRKLFGTSPQAMLTRLRIDRAKELLRSSDLTVKEIGSKLGYSRQHDLNRAFRKYTGMSPRAYRILR